MKEELEKLQLDNKELLTNQLIASGYAFAAWKLPNDEDLNFIISLHPCEKVSQLTIAELGAGFIVNSYSESHPVSPYFIPADIKLQNNQQEISPLVSGELIDKFTKEINGDLKSKSTLETHKWGNRKSHSNNFKSLVAGAVNSIKAGHFEKVVLSRFKEEQLPEGFSIWSYFELLCNKYKNAFCSLTFIPEKGVWVGASPELLISDNDQRFKTVALAATKKLEPNQELNEIAWTQKEIEEQALVSRYIINCFKKIRLREFHEHGPKTVQAGSLAHLKTTFEVKYNELFFERLSDQMIELLHPTSAVCGMPIEYTKPWIASKEDYNREFYAGFLGPVNNGNSTDLYVNLRCAQIYNGIIRFYAGAGITEDSNPDREFEETEMKIDVLSKLLK